jgi:hypothetical protein
MSNSTGTRIVGKVYGDLTGSVFEPTVVGLRNIPISATPPLNNQTLMYVAASGSYIPAYVSGSGGSGEAYDQSLNTTDNVVFTNISLSSSGGKIILGQNYDDTGITNLYLAVGNGNSPSSKSNLFYISDTTTYSNNTIYGRHGYYTGDLTVEGTASIGVVNAISQSSLYVGDKYITMASGSATHDELDDSGIKWGTGSAEGETIDAGVHAYVKYNWMSGASQIDRIQIYPGILSNTITGTVISGTYYGDGSNLGGVIKSLTGYATQEYVTSSITSALSPYLTSQDASGTFISASQLAPYLTTQAASGTFISASQLSADYLLKSEASGTFVSSSQLARYAILNTNNTFSGNIILTGTLDLYTTGSFRINNLAYSSGTALFIGAGTSQAGGFYNTYIRSKNGFTTFISDTSGGLTAGNSAYTTNIYGSTLNLFGYGGNLNLSSLTNGGAVNIATSTSVSNSIGIGNITTGRNITLAVSGSSSTSGSTRYIVQVSGALYTNSTASFAGPLSGTNAYFANNVTILGTASIGQLNTVNQTNLVVGDKYITILSGGVDHSGINGSGLLWGSGSGTTGQTTGSLGEHAHILFRDTGDLLEIYPGISSSYVRINELTSSFVSSSYISGVFYGEGQNLISLPYDIAGQKVGKATADEYIYRMIAVRSFSIDGTNSYFSSSISATSTNNLYINKNNTTVWTASYAAGAAAATVSWPVNAFQNFSPGDILSVVASTEDATLENIYFTIKGKTT